MICWASQSAFKVKLVIYPTFITTPSFSSQKGILETIPLAFISVQIFKIIPGIQREDTNEENTELEREIY